MQSYKKIQIDRSLFIDLYIYAIEHADYNDQRFCRIEKGVTKKLNADYQRNLYTKYKSGESEEEREHARQAYLEELGIPSSFQWNSNQDVNVTRKLF